jgi:hypothetical protein
MVDLDRIHVGPFCFAVLALVVGILWFFSGFALLRTELRVADTALSKIGALALGQVAVAGNAGGQVVDAPFTRKSCHFARSALWKRVSDGRNSSWHHVATVLWPPEPTFSVTDETGSIEVIVRDVELDLEKMVTYLTVDCSPGDAALLAKYNLSPSSDTRVWSEWLPSGSDVYVCGTATQPPGERDKPIIESGSRGKLLVSVHIGPVSRKG